MTEIIRCTVSDYPALVEIWERSVRATHDFLTEEAIQEIKGCLPKDYFPNVNRYALQDNDTLAGFIGLSDRKIEMLFIDSTSRGNGYGSMLIELAKEQGATEVDVNEQNSSAVGFYMAKGFKLVGRDATDSAGRPYPILHLAL